MMETSENSYYNSGLDCLFQMTLHLGNSLSVIKMGYTGVNLTEYVGACFGKSSNRKTWIICRIFSFRGQAQGSNLDF